MPSLIETLTPLQFKVVILMVTGMSVDEIAQFLNLSGNVITTILHNVCLAAHCSDRADVVMRYVSEAEEGLYFNNQFRNDTVEIENRAHQLLSEHDSHNHK